MTADTKRSRLINYLADADDKKVAALYSVLEGYMIEHEGAVFTNEQMDIINKRSEELSNGKVDSVAWQTIHDNVRAIRKSAK